MYILKTILISFFFIGIFYCQSDSNFEFKYSILTKSAQNLDDLVAVDDSSIIYSGDQIRINIGYLPETYFYVIYVDTESNYSIIYSKKSELTKIANSLYFDTVLPWTKFVDPPGFETFYLINSRNKLEDLELSFSQYAKASGKMKLKLSKRIQSNIDNLNPTHQSMSHFASRLEDPLVGGVTFRGEDENKISDMSVTHSCKGNDGFAIKRVILDHLK